MKVVHRLFGPFLRGEGKKKKRSSSKTLVKKNSLSSLNVGVDNRDLKKKIQEMENTLFF